MADGLKDFLAGAERAVNAELLVSRLGVSKKAADEALSIETTIQLPRSNRQIDKDALEALAINAAVRAEQPYIWNRVRARIQKKDEGTLVHEDAIKAVIKVLSDQGVSVKAEDNCVATIMAAAHRINGNKTHEGLPPH